MASSETDTDYLLNLFNIPKPNSKCALVPASPSPSAQSENSIECNQNTNDTVVSSDDDSEQELTNLTWLTQLKNLAAWPDFINPILDDDLDDKLKVTNVLKKDTVADRFNKFIDQVVKSRTDYDASAELFQSNSEVKPTFNYAQIIAMAMHENGRMTLQQICTWIERKFAYFRARKNWNNSIRHNLSLHCCFRKIDRSKYEKGKGGYWELGIDATKSDRKRVRNRKRRCSPSKEEVHVNSPDEKRSKSDLHEPIQQTNIVEEKVIQDFFESDELRDFNLEANLDMTSVIEQTFNEIEHCDIYQSGKDLSPDDDELNTAVTSIAAAHNELNVDFCTDDSFLRSNDGVSSTIEMLRDEFHNGTTMVDPTTMNIQQDEIFLSNDVPQPSENIVISILNNHPCDGPNVIVEPIPYAMPTEDSYKPFFDEIDEEFEFLRNCENRDDLIDSLYDIATNDF